MKNTQYIAFLRGVNVKGTNMKMKEVCALFEKINLENVSSVLATGNILFSSSKNSDELKIILQKAMTDHFLYEAFLFVKNKEELEKIVINNPFAINADFHTYGFIGVDNIDSTLLDEFEKSKVLEGEQAEIVNNNFYWKVPKGNTLGSEFGKILGSKKLKNSFTSRNLNTLEKVLKKCTIE